jgi:hypothetical protein
VEITIVETDRSKADWRLEADRFVSRLAQFRQDIGRRHRHSHDQMGGAPAPHGSQGHAHRCAGSDTVVDDDRCVAFELRRRTVRTVDLPAPLDLGELTRRLFFKITEISPNFGDGLKDQAAAWG